MIEKLRTGIWFLNRPNHWQHATALTMRKFLPNHDAPDLRQQAGIWASKRAVTVSEALTKLGVKGEIQGFDNSLMKEATERATDSGIRMGGPGDLDLLSDAVRLTKAKKVIETGVAYGWSSLAILSIMHKNGGGSLFSVDMPYPKMGNESFVGIVVPERLRSRWTLIREPDRGGLKKAIVEANGPIDLCHYDSDKSWWGRAYAFPLLWEALRPGGLFISDDIQDNMYFAKFAELKNLPFAVTKSEGKFVGIIRKL